MNAPLQVEVVISERSPVADQGGIVILCINLDQMQSGTADDT